MGNCTEAPGRPLCALTCTPQVPGGQCVTLFSTQHVTVDLAVSVFPAAKDWVLAGHQVYHTSVILGPEEYYFNPQGLQVKQVPARFGIPPSHENKSNTVVFEVGHTRRSGLNLLEKLGEYFRPGSYDLIAKNCNAFTDCALAFLLSRRLPLKYCSVEKIGQGMPSLLNWASGGKYKANLKAQDFDLEAVVLRVDENAWMGTAEAAKVFEDAPVTKRTNSAVSC